MSEPARANFTLYRGVPRTLRFTMTGNGSVAGWTTRLYLRTEETAPNPLAFEKPGTVADAGSGSTPGIFEVAVTKAESLTLAARPYKFSFERTDVGQENLLTIGVAQVAYDIANPK